MKRAAIIFIALVSCTAPKEKIPPPMSVENASDKVVIYQMMTRLFGNKTTANKPFGSRDENAVEKFKDIHQQAL